MSRSNMNINMLTRALIVGSLTVLAAGCSMVHKQRQVTDDGLAWTRDPVPPPTNGAIYQTSRAISLFENPVASHVGDIVTIVLADSKDSSSKGGASSGKGSESSSSSSSSKSSSSGSDGDGLSSSITATVMRVLPNGNLFLKGEKLMGDNKGYVRVTGVIRPMDLQTDNTVSSTKVASARISYGKTAMDNATAQNWLAKFFNYPRIPF